MPSPFVQQLDLSHAPTLWQCFHDSNPLRFLVGPLGSGKTTFTAAECYSRAMQQTPSPDGIRRFKLGVVRNTMPMLKRTTIQTWLAMFPEDMCGPLRWSSPAVHRIKLRPSPDFRWNDDGTYEGEPGLDLQVEFFALDQPKDVRELLSWEGTMLWFNEIREIPKAIIDMARKRVGRFPSMRQGGVRPTWFGIIGDTNPPDEDHWIYALEQGVDEFGEFIGRMPGLSVYHQPPAVIEIVQVGEEHWQSVEAEQTKLDIYTEHHVHRAAGTLWAVNPEAENLPWLEPNTIIDPTGDPLGPGSYYADGLGQYSRDWIRCYFQGRYGFVREGKPVVEEFDPQIMVSDDVPIMDGADIFAGSDIGGNTLNPAAVFFQPGPRGIWLVHGEVTASGMGQERFEVEMSREWSRLFGNRPCSAMYGDPAGRQKDGIFETVFFDHLIMKGWPAMPAPSSDPRVGIDAIKGPMMRSTGDGKTGILIHRRCSRLIKALSGAWFYRRVQRTGSSKFAETPDKSHPYSDVGQALGYGLSGAGETSMAVRRRRSEGDGVDGPMAARRFQPGQSIVVNTSFDVFD